LLCAILVAGGFGSALSVRVPARAACLAVAALGAIAAFGLSKLIPLLLPFELNLRAAIAIALIAPFGLMMGMPFPQGLRQTGKGSLPSPPFYWGLDGIMSVFCSVGTVLLELILVFCIVFICGLFC